MTTNDSSTQNAVKPQESSKPRRPRGSGSIYRQKGSTKWWLQYFKDGKPYRQSSGTNNRTKAEAVLRRKLGEIATNAFIEPARERVKVRELFESLRLDYQNNERKSWDDTERRWKRHLEPVLGNLQAVHVTTTCLNAFVNQRKQARASNAEINREMAVLRRMFTLGEVVNRARFPHLDETKSIRKGFLEDDRYSKLATACAKIGLWLRAMFETGYQFGWRDEEVKKLRVHQVDLAEHIIRLEVGETKNDDGREVEMPDTLYELIKACVLGKQPNDFVFTRHGGKPVRDFRGSWKAATTEAGVPGLLFHDLRRTAVRNMVRAGIPERVAMQISGHKTRSIFDRYHIVAKRDLHEAKLRMEQQRREREQLAAAAQTAPDFRHRIAIVGRQNGQLSDSAKNQPIN